MWQPEPGWLALPGGSSASTVGVWRTVLGDQPVVVKRLAAPLEDDPAELTHPRHFAYWRRVGRGGRHRHRRRDPGPARTAAGRGRGGRRGHHAHRGVGRGRRDQRAVHRARARPVRRRAPRPGAVAGPQPAARPDGPGRATRRLARPWPAPPSRTSPTTCGGDVPRCWPRPTRSSQVPQHGDPTPANLPGREGDDVVAVDWAMLGTGPVGADLGYYALAAREELEPLLDAYLMGLPDGLADPRRGHPRRPDHRGLHGPEPRRVGAGPRRRGRGRAGRQVPPPVGGAAPARAAAAVPARRGAARDLDLERALGERVARFHGAER